ncbi:hypothetical protein [Candidatus Scalindua japonica]|uniref:hypothetical protein n=1 Tax=Candidatus Scalindua japonica TaxID=1284222 RepID=UPI000BDEE06F|nr:hypothetical protein [Candidatus Scalindua japonica]
MVYIAQLVHARTKTSPHALPRENSTRQNDIVGLVVGLANILIWAGMRISTKHLKLSRNIFDFYLQAITMEMFYAEVAELADALG